VNTMLSLKFVCQKSAKFFTRRDTVSSGLCSEDTKTATITHTNPIEVRWGEISNLTFLAEGKFCNVYKAAYKDNTVCVKIP